MDDKVDASAEAYEKLQVGDAFLGFVSYGVALLLAAAGGRRRWREQPERHTITSGMYRGA